MGLSTIYRRQQEKLALALIEKSRRAKNNPDELPLLEWTILRRARLKPGLAFDLSHHGYLAGIYGCSRREVVVYKASQLGISEYGISFILHAADQRKATGLYVFPTDRHVSDFSAARLGPAIEASLYLERIVIDGGSERIDGRKQRGADKVTLKRVRNNFIYLRGAKVEVDGRAPQLKSIDADVLVLDEIDEMDPRAPDIAEKRLGHSLIKDIRWISTPTYPGIGIHAKWLESDQREWFVRCPACGKRQPLTINLCVLEWDQLERPVKWRSDPNLGAYLGCVKCGKPLDRLGAGEWVATYPERELAGFHPTKLFSSTTSLEQILEALTTIDETKRREAFNQDLGLPYIPRGGKLMDEGLDACRRDYAHGPPEVGAPTYLGCDVGRVLHVVIRAGPDKESGERRQLFAGQVDSFEALGNLIRQYHVSRAVIDALPETRKCRELQTEFPGILYLAYYTTQKVGSKLSESAQWNEAEGVVNLDRTRMLDATFALFFGQKNTLPAYAKDIRDYYAHMKALTRILIETTGGEKVAQYIQSGPDHYAHAENYCTAAGENAAPSEAVVVQRQAAPAEKEEPRRKSAWR